MLTKRHFLLSTMAAISSASLAQFSHADTEKTPKKALVIVSLADNENQGIVPIPTDLGNGQNPRTNLYWGALYGVKTYFTRSQDYTVRTDENYGRIKGLLENITITSNDHDDVEITALAIDGRFQSNTLSLYYAHLQSLTPKYDLVVYVGHNPLMDIDEDFKKPSIDIQDIPTTKTAVLACHSRSYFKDIIAKTNSEAYVMTNGNMAPEAYVLDGILNAWMNGEGADVAREKAAINYAKYQKIPLKNANWLFSAS